MSHPYPTDALAAGTPAPAFALPATPDQAVSLEDLRGHPVILAFYPADWSPVCGDQMALYNQVLPAFRRTGAQLVGISVDGAWCHAAFSAQRNLHFPLLSDFEPKGEVARRYGVYRDRDGFSAVDRKIDAAQHVGRRDASAEPYDEALGESTNLESDRHTR